MRSFVTVFGGLLVAFELFALFVPMNAAPTTFAAPLLALTETAEPPTNTPVPPVDTPVPPTDTAVVAADTPVPPTNTAVVAADTPVPSTDTPAPTDKPERKHKPTATATPPEATAVVVAAEPSFTPQPTEVPSAVTPPPTDTAVVVAARVPPVVRPRRMPVTGTGDGAHWLLLALGGGLMAAGLLIRRKPSP